VTDATAGAGLPEWIAVRALRQGLHRGKRSLPLADRSALAGSAARMIDLVRVMVREVNVPIK
jgi:N-acetylglucosamine-6-phosphate deacetylase